MIGLDECLTFRAGSYLGGSEGDFITRRSPTAPRLSDLIFLLSIFTLRLFLDLPRRGGRYCCYGTAPSWLRFVSEGFYLHSHQLGRKAVVSVMDLQLDLQYKVPLKTSYVSQPSIRYIHTCCCPCSLMSVWFFHRRIAHPPPPGSCWRVLRSSQTTWSHYFGQTRELY